MENLVGTLWVDGRAVTVVATKNSETPQHDKFCHETGYGPKACMTCQLIDKVRTDERSKHGIV